MARTSLLLISMAIATFAAACGGTVTSTSGGPGGTGGSGGTAGTSGTGGSAGGAACTGDGSSTLPGVHIDFPAQPCKFTLAEAAAGISIAYSVVIDQSVSGVLPEPQDAGNCGSPGPSGLIVFEQLEGGGQSYCLCDVGLCPPPSDVPVTLSPGTYPGTFEWDGKNWNGPSDTGNPKGSPFPAGSYTLTVSAIGQSESMGGNKNPFKVEGTFGIVLVP
jgi:hypothetical protein